MFILSFYGMSDNRDVVLQHTLALFTAVLIIVQFGQ